MKTECLISRGIAKLNIYDFVSCRVDSDENFSNSLA